MARITTFSRYLLVGAIVSGVSASALAAGGNAGIVVPADDEPPASTQSSAPKNNASMPGIANPSPATAPSPAASKAQTETPLQYTPGPNSNLVVHDLGLAAAIYSDHPEIKPPVTNFKTIRHININHKAAIVYVMENEIARAMASINDKDLSRSERDKNAKTAFKKLSIMTDGLHRRQAMPDSIYKSLGLDDIYIKEERDGDAEALTKLYAALETLKPLQ